MEENQNCDDLETAKTKEEFASEEGRRCYKNLRINFLVLRIIYDLINHEVLGLYEYLDISKRIYDNLVAGTAAKVPLKVNENLKAWGFSNAIIQGNRHFEVEGVNWEELLEARDQARENRVAIAKNIYYDTYLSLQKQIKARDKRVRQLTGNKKEEEVSELLKNDELLNYLQGKIDRNQVILDAEETKSSELLYEELKKSLEENKKRVHEIIVDLKEKLRKVMANKEVSDDADLIVAIYCCYFKKECPTNNKLKYREEVATRKVLKNKIKDIDGVGTIMVLMKKVSWEEAVRIYRQAKSESSGTGRRDSSYVQYMDALKRQMELFRAARVYVDMDDERLKKEI